MQRRELLRVFGAATTLALIPRDAFAVWERVAIGVRPASGLTDAQLALISAVGDTILPRTDTPSASDVGVPAFVDIIVSENYSDADRDAFIAGLDAIETGAKSVANGTFVDLSPDIRGTVIAALESDTDRRAEPARTYWRLKGLIVHGYFTSEPVMKNVLKVQVMPGKFDGAAPMPMKEARTPGDAHA
jgi:hypothetical protein